MRVGKKEFMRKRLPNDEILIGGGHLPPKEETGVVNGRRGEVEEKQFQRTVPF